ncbi:hypothetical protein [Streptosporangium amethystogenes]|uniref:hypothetical protein n=1 Tax=Streptosporangium amethystogenes TaxID=2002 RepID=UPI0004CA37AC|nr:hypothetical protein [Streptosporangium amethystogenes]
MRSALRRLAAALLMLPIVIAQPAHAAQQQATVTFGTTLERSGVFPATGPITVVDAYGRGSTLPSTATLSLGPSPVFVDGPIAGITG